MTPSAQVPAIRNLQKAVERVQSPAASADIDLHLVALRKSQGTPEFAVPNRD